jgi:hypothetical protein
VSMTGIVRRDLAREIARAAQAASVAALVIRPGKVARPEPLRLREQWQHRADELGFGTEIERVHETTRLNGRATRLTTLPSPTRPCPTHCPRPTRRWTNGPRTG